MFQQLLGESASPVIAFIGILAAFFLTCVSLAKGSTHLPKDQGREFAVGGALSAGKPRGAGLIFVLVFAITSVLFAHVDPEMIIYLLLLICCMMTGYLDDAAKTSWGRLKKGILDFLVALLVTFTYLHFNGNQITLALTGSSFSIPAPVFAVLSIALIWISINVTNCADGVDGLSGTLTIITIMTFYFANQILGRTGDFDYLSLLFVVCLLGYLWFNATPSKMLMGDAGSRAMGLFIAIAALKCHDPFLYILAALVLIIDGGLGLVKLTLIKTVHVHILKNVRTPIHDFVRKTKGWSNTQTVFRFAIIQIILSVALIYLIML